MNFDFARALGVSADSDYELDRVVYLPKGMTKVVIKLYPEPIRGEPDAKDMYQILLDGTFAEVTDVYQGTENKAFIVRCMLLDGWEKENSADKVRFLKLPKSVVAAIAAELNDGEDLLSWHGTAIIIRRNVVGGKTSYSVKVSRETFNTDPEQQPTKTVQEVAKSYTEWKLGQNVGTPMSSNDEEAPF
jgi:hypothetical protein